MNKLILIILAVVLVGAGAYFFMSQQQQQKQSSTNEPVVTQAPTTQEQTESSTEVTIENFSYSPATITIKAGDTVTWTNNDSVAHTATADDESFDTGLLEKGQSTSVTFDTPGTYTYHCTPHPNMKGTVVVE